MDGGWASLDDIERGQCEYRWRVGPKLIRSRGHIQSRLLQPLTLYYYYHMLDFLPIEIIIQVFSYLGYRDLLTCSLVSPTRHLVPFNHTTIIPGVPHLSYSRTGERFLPIYHRPRRLWYAKWSS